MLLEGPGAHDQERVLQAATALDYGEVALLPGDMFEERVTVVGVEERSADANCGGAVARRTWEGQLEVAHEQLQLLQIDDALSTLAMLELELACWESVFDPDAARTLYREVEATHELAGEMKPEAAAFHRQEAERAREHLAALGVSPHGTAFVVGGGSLGQVLLDGEPIDRVAERIPAGPHLVQVLSEGEVVAARTLNLAHDERAVLWAGEAYPGVLALEVDFLARGVGAPILLPYAALVLEESLLVAVVTTDAVRFYSPTGILIEATETLVEVPPASAQTPAPKRSPRPDRRVELGASGAVAYHQGRLPGSFTGVALHARYGLSPTLDASVTIQPQLQRSRLPDAYDHDAVWRLGIPVRVGLQFTKGRQSVGPELALLVAGPGLGVEVAPVLALRRTELNGPLKLTVDAYGGGTGASWQAGLAIGMARGL